MGTPSERKYLRICKREIEKALALALGNNGIQVKSRNLEYLSRIIEEKSGISISLSTLKRLWNEDFSKMPQPATLNALVSVLDYRDWQEFKQHHQDAGTIKYHRRTGKTVIIVASLVVIPVVVFAFMSIKEHLGKPVINGDVVFTANKTRSSGVPNTVVFTYDLSNVVADSFYFQQSWNYRLKEPIDPKGTAFSNIYYQPGFHRAKLIANNTVIATQNIHILSQGWVSYVKYDIHDRLPIYINRTDFLPEGGSHIDKSDLEDAGIDGSKEFVFRLVNSRDFGVSDDHFTLNTTFKCDSIRPLSCPKMDLMLGFERNVFWVDLVKSGCEHYATYLIGEVYAEGKSSDLSALGCNIYEWQELTFSVRDRHAEVFLNGQSIIDLSYEQEFGKLKVLYYTFDGPGSVDFVSLAGKDGQIVYDYDFE